MKIYVTGGSGFFGRQIVALLEEEHEVLSPRSKEVDLTRLSSIAKFLDDEKPDLVIHSAAYYGGLGINVAEPAKIFFLNTTMTVNLFESMAQAGIGKFISIGSACSYPGNVAGDMREDELWSGRCHLSVEAYGISKKIHLVAMEAYRKQYDLESSQLILTNLYGEHDEFGEYRSHVPAAFVKKFCDAVKNKDDKVTCWSDGSQVREFIYVKDAAEAVVRVIGLGHQDKPINIGTGIGTTIRELAEIVKKHSGFEGEIVWDTSKPGGVQRKVLDISYMEEVLEWCPETTLNDGMRNTIEWYKEQE